MRVFSLLSPRQGGQLFLTPDKVFMTPRVQELKHRDWLPHQLRQPGKKPRFPAALFWALTTNLSVTGSTNLSFAYSPALRKLLHVISNQLLWAHWGSGMAFSLLAPLASLSLPTELTDFRCQCPKQKGSCWHRAIPVPLPSTPPCSLEPPHLLHRGRGQAQASYVSITYRLHHTAHCSEQGWGSYKLQVFEACAKVNVTGVF